MPDNLTWHEARDLARAGTPVRRLGWTDRWLVYLSSLWWLVYPRLSTRVVQAADFGRAEFFAADYTSEPWLAECRLPTAPPAPPDPASLQFTGLTVDQRYYNYSDRAGINAQGASPAAPGVTMTGSFSTIFNLAPRSVRTGDRFELLLSGNTSDYSGRSFRVVIDTAEGEYTVQKLDAQLVVMVVVNGVTSGGWEVSINGTQKTLLKSSRFVASISGGTLNRGGYAYRETRVIWTMSFRAFPTPVLYGHRTLINPYAVPAVAVLSGTVSNVLYIDGQRASPAVLSESAAVEVRKLIPAGGSFDIAVSRRVSGFTDHDSAVSYNLTLTWEI